MAVAFTTPVDDSGSSFPALIGMTVDPTGTVVTVSITGEIDLAIRIELKNALKRALVGRRAVIVDLSSCSFMDATGLNCLAAAQPQARAHNTALIVVCPKASQPRHVLELTLAGIFTIVETHSDAIAHPTS